MMYPPLLQLGIVPPIVLHRVAQPVSRRHRRLLTPGVGIGGRGGASGQRPPGGARFRAGGRQGGRVHQPRHGGVEGAAGRRARHPSVLVLLGVVVVVVVVVHLLLLVVQGGAGRLGVAEGGRVRRAHEV